MEELQFGPNGALVYCMEYLAENLDWLEEQLDGFIDDDYLLIDCPGQIELYSHIPVMRRVCDVLRRSGFNVCGVYLVDALFITDASKLIAGNLTALAAMVHLELPHINVLSKCDVADKASIERYLSPSGEALVAELARSTDERFRGLNRSIAKLLDDYDMVSFVPLDITDEGSVEAVLLQVDNAIQFGEDAEPREPKDEEGGAEGSGYGDGDGGYDGDD